MTQAVGFRESGFAFFLCFTEDSEAALSKGNIIQATDVNLKFNSNYINFKKHEKKTLKYLHLVKYI